jgi:hypothetical protein
MKGKLKMAEQSTRGRGRPVKNPTPMNEKNVKKIAEETAMKLIEEYEKKLKEANAKIEALTKNNIVNVKSNFKFIPDHTKVRIKSNIEGKFLYRDDRGKTKVFIELNNYGDEALLDYDELKVLHFASGGYLRKGMLAIIDVISDSDITINDVIIDLRLDKQYNDPLITPINLDILFTDTIDFKTFEQFLVTHKEMAETCLIVSYVLYKQGLFNDNGKMAFLRQSFNNQNLYL